MFLDGLRREVAGDHAEVSFFFSRTFKGGRGDGRSEWCEKCRVNCSDILSNGSAVIVPLETGVSHPNAYIKISAPISAVFIFGGATEAVVRISIPPQSTARRAGAPPHPRRRRRVGIG
jgi:hypothetical protein